MPVKKIKRFVTEAGKCPFDEWFAKLPLRKKQLVIYSLKKLSLGASKRNIRSLKGGLFEIKIKSEGGMRLYFGEDKNAFILLLVGGDKSSQKRDINIARNLWSNDGL